MTTPGEPTTVPTDVPTDAPTDVPTDVPSDAPSGPPAEGAPSIAPAGRYLPVEVVNVDFHLASPSPVLQLRESDPPYRVVHFPIGLPEAQAIALALEHEHAPRPTTSELLASVAAASGTDVIAVRLTGTSKGTVLAQLDLMTPRGREVLDCRPSDGICLALRRGPAPMLCEEGLFDAE